MNQRQSAPSASDAAAALIQHEILPRARDLGDGFTVQRVLPAAARRMVGPFVFFDQFGPVEFAPGRGIDVRPHPHIGLATVTYLFEGGIVHRDSLGSVQAIAPGDVNWMTAGRGIVHSERSDAALRQRPQRLQGIQIWVALPQRHEETAPAFAHYPAATLPLIEGEGKSVRVVAGALFGQRSPVATLSDLFYAAATLTPGASLLLDAEHAERAAYLLDGAIEIDGRAFASGRLLVFAPGRPLTIRATAASRLLLLGGEPLDGPRHLWWNFVASRQDRIEQAREDWKQGRFAPVPGETEFIPLPES
ncbi:MAG TPA: pirin family protein [Candidatus Angelobacter sp.]|nr:pirin family protein [Candidatus Angelobacter sp.]